MIKNPITGKTIGQYNEKGEFVPFEVTVDTELILPAVHDINIKTEAQAIQALSKMYSKAVLGTRCAMNSLNTVFEYNRTTGTWINTGIAIKDAHLLIMLTSEIAELRFMMKSLVGG